MWHTRDERVCVLVHFIYTHVYTTVGVGNVFTCFKGVCRVCSKAPPYFTLYSIRMCVLFFRLLTTGRERVQNITLAEIIANFNKPVSLSPFLDFYIAFFFLYTPPRRFANFFLFSPDVTRRVVYFMRYSISLYLLLLLIVSNIQCIKSQKLTHDVNESCF